MPNRLKAYTISGFPCSAFDNIGKHCNHRSKFSSQSTDTPYLAKPYAHPADIVKKTHRTHCIHVHWCARAHSLPDYAGAASTTTVATSCSSPSSACPLLCEASLFERLLGATSGSPVSAPCVALHTHRPYRGDFGNQCLTHRVGLLP